MGNPKPLIQAACICDNIIIDGEGVATLIRIIDKIQVNIPTGLPAGLQAGFPLNIFVRVGAGEARGSGTVSIQARKPDGKSGGKAISHAVFSETHHGVQVKTQFQVVGPQDGIYWFDVLWNDELLTSFPLEVKLVAEPVPSVTIGQTGPTPSSPGSH